MSRPKPAFTPDPRAWTEYQVAVRLNWSEVTFKKRLPKLEAEGFPRVDKLLGGRDAKAIEAWFDKRSGLGVDPLSQATEAALAAVRGRHAGRA